jgi:NTE family protein
VIVDGGLLSSFPIWLFDVPPDTPPAFPTFGLTHTAPAQREPVLPAGRTSGLAAGLLADVGYLKVIVETILQAHDRRALDAATHARTIPLPTLGITAIDFDIDDEGRQALFDAGHRATAAFLAGWDFGAYFEALAMRGAS